MWAVEVTHTDPETVRHDARFGDRENYYRRVTLPGPLGWIYLKVCVAFGPGDSGQVVTV